MSILRTNERPFPIHPGEFLREDFMSPLELSSNRLAMELRVPATRILEIVREKRGISADTALRLAKYFGTTPEFWMNMQQQYDLSLAQQAAAGTLATVQRRSA